MGSRISLNRRSYLNLQAAAFISDVFYFKASTIIFFFSFVDNYLFVKNRRRFLFP